MRVIMERILRTGPDAVLFDSERLAEPSLDWFEPAAWERAGAVHQRFGGRGEAIAVDGPFGAGVLKVYHRGGLVRHLVRRRYAWTGLGRTRSVREWRVLRAMFDAGLPVPEPLAAHVQRSGPTYRAALLTRRIENARPLSDAAADLDQARWADVDALIDRFARAGLSHADLNATNILVDPDETLWMIDFDRARISDRPVRPRPMHARLARSLEKLGIQRA